MTDRRLTIILSYRDREVERVRRSLESLLVQTRNDFYVNFVDYGSQTVNASTVRELTDSFEFCRYFYSDTRGHPWNRARALNIGIRHAQSEFVLTTDVDMIFAPNFVEAVLEAQDGHTLIHCAPHWMPEGFSKWSALIHYRDKFPVGDRSQRGGCQCAPYKAIVEIGGFDESYEYWGTEDRDIFKRLLQSGLSELWVDDITSIYHQWHPREQRHVPRGYAQRWVEPYLKRVGAELTRNNSSWGLIVTRDDRELFSLLPEADIGKIVDWGTFLVRITHATRVATTSTRWIMTNAEISPVSTDVAPTSYQRIFVDSPGSGYLLHHDMEKECEIETHFSNAIANLTNTDSIPPEVIVVYVPTFWRLSRNLLQSLLDVVAPGGLIAIANLNQPRLPFSWRCCRAVLPNLLEWLCPRLWRISPKATRQCQNMLVALRAPNDLHDSLLLARVGVTGINDFALDFPVRGGAAIFLKDL